MGALLSRFRKEATTEQKLEELQEKIKKIEEYGVNTQERKKRFVGGFIAVAIGIYVIVVFSMIYFIRFPVTWKERLIYTMPLLTFPYIILLLRRLFTWHFERKLNKNSAMLTKLRTEKKDILEQVMNKETYKVAVNLLQRFGDKSINHRRSLDESRGNQRPFITSPQVSNQSLTPMKVTNSSNQSTFSGSLSSHFKQPSPLVASQAQNQSTLQVSTDQRLRRRTVFPIINPAERGFFERCLDFLIGDGPQHRFAVICKECHYHNGMALREEFDYITYRCAFCNALNPARKTRPVAPLLTFQSPNAGRPSTISHSQSDESSESSESSIDDDDNDDDADLQCRRRRVQVRLTESTGNHSESPEVAAIPATTPTHSPIKVTTNEPKLPVSSNPFENTSDEPMDGVEEEGGVAVAAAAADESHKPAHHPPHGEVSDADKKAN